MTAVAHFYCRPNSHPFQERHVPLNEATKIGRSVARCRPSPNNAVFDCKVLSRNHALLWFENGKFFLQDTKSSNGTFVNNQRLSKASEESSAVEVNSCDIVQFGVDVVDSMRKVTHGCIVSQLRLYLPNGEESKQSNCAWNNQAMEKVPYNSIYPAVQAQDLYQLHRYLQEALHREQMLEQKLALLQRLVVSSQDASEKGWQALIDEDRLLSRLEFLENQLQSYNKTQSEDSLKSQLQLVQEEKYNYENTSKETLQQAVQEKLEAVRKFSNLERSFGNTEDECTHLRHMHEQTQSELATLATSHQTKIQEVRELTDKLQEAERQLNESKKDFQSEKDELEKKFEESLEEEERLKENLLLLEEENVKLKEVAETNEAEATTEQAETEGGNIVAIETILSNTEMLENLINTAKNNSEFKEALQLLSTVQSESPDAMTEVDGEATDKLTDNFVNSTNEIVETVNSSSDANEETRDENTDHSKHQLDEGVEEPDATTKELEALKDQLKSLEEKFQEEIRAEEESRRKVEEQLARVLEEREQQAASLNETNKELQAALSDRESLMEREEELRVMMEDSEKMARLCRASSMNEPDGLDEDDITSPVILLFKGKLKKLQGNLDATSEGLRKSEEENVRLKEQIALQSLTTEIQQEEAQMLANGDASAEDKVSSSEGSAPCVEELPDAKKIEEQEEEVQRLEEELVIARRSLGEREEEIRQLQDELASSQESARLLPDLRNELASTQSLAQQRDEECTSLQSQLSKAEDTVQEVKTEILTLQGKLEEEHGTSSKYSIETQDLRDSCDKQALFVEVLQNREKDALDKLEAALEELKQREDEIANLNSNLKESLAEKETAESKINELNNCLVKAEREKESIREELRKLEDTRVEQEHSFLEQVETNKSLQEQFNDEKEKWESCLVVKEGEIEEVTSRCQQLIQERERQALNLHRPSATKRLLVVSLFVVLLSLLYMFLYADPLHQHPM